MLQYNTFGGFIPVMDEPTLSQIIENYTARPRSFSREQIDMIRQHAQYYNIPFAEDEQTWVDYVGGVIKQAVGGYITGFTTINVGGAPQTPAESIARAVGSVAGFAGYLPGTPIRAIGAAKNLPGLAKLGEGLTKARGHSIPLMLAEGIMKKGSSIFNAATAKQSISGASAIKSSMDFLKNPAVNNYIQRGLRLGIASGISSWQGGIDHMMKSFLWGTTAGAIDASIGNLIRMNDKVGEMALKGLAGAMADGLPSTLRGDTTPEQVYYYLRGAYFGAQELPWYKRYAQQKFLEWRKTGGDPDDFIKSSNMPRAAVKDFKSYAYEDVLRPEGEAAFQSVFMTPEYVKRYEEAYKAASTHDKEAISDGADPKVKNLPSDVDGESSGTGQTIPFVPPSRLISSIVRQDMKKLFRAQEGNSIEAMNIALADISGWHTRLAEEQATNPYKNHYTVEMVRQLKTAYYNDKEIPREILNKLRRIQVSFELNQQKRYLRPVFDSSAKEGKQFSLDITDENSKSTPNGKILTESVSPNAYGNREVWLDNLYVGTSKDMQWDEVAAIDVAGMLRNPPKKMSDRQTAQVDQLKQVIHTALTKHGLYHFGGNNAKTAMAFMPFHDTIKNMSDADISRVMEQYISLIHMSPKYNKDRTPREDIARDVYDSLKADNLYDTTVGKRIWVSNILYEIENQMGFANKVEDAVEYFAKYAPPDFDIASNTKSWTKRNQLFFDPQVPHRKEWLLDKFFSDPANQEKFKNFDNSRVLVIEDAKGKFSDNPNGLAEFYEGATDGGTIPLREVMVGTERGYGFEEGAGEIKAGATGAKGDPNGVLIVKTAWHAAVPDWVYAKMKEQGITHLVFRTAAKHIGKYKTATWDEFVNGTAQGRIIEMPWSSWKVNIGKHFSLEHTYGKHAVPTQTIHLVTSLLSEGEELNMVESARAGMLDILKMRNVNGTQEANDVVQKFLDTNSYAKREALREDVLNAIDDAGKKYINLLIKDRRPGSIAPELLTLILDSNKASLRDDLDDKLITEEEYDSAVTAASREASNLEHFLSLMQDNPESVLDNPLVRRIADKAIRSYMTKGITRPKTGDSGDFVIAPYIAQAWKDDPNMSRLNSDKSLFFLGKDAAEHFKLTRRNGKKESLGKIWSRVQSTGKENADPEDLELLRFVVTRTPQGSPAGAIVLEFGGFDGSQGSRVYVHPVVANLLGGADYDIDTVKVLGGNSAIVDGKVVGDGISKEFKDAVKVFERYAYEKVAGATQQQVIQKSFNEPIDTAVYQEYISNAKYYDNKQVEIPEFSETGKLYHGTRTNKVRIVNGKLVLYPSSNFGGKQIGISFTTSRDVAKFYGEHTVGDTRKVADGASIIEIDKKYLPNITRESTEEFMSNTKEAIEIPAGGFKIYNSEDTLRTQVELDKNSIEDLLIKIDESDGDKEVFFAVRESIKRKMLTDGVDKVLADASNADVILVRKDGPYDRELTGDEYLREVIDIDAIRKQGATTTTQQQPQPKFSWARTAANNYEVSSEGDKTYSALYAKLKDGRTIEEAYQSAKGSGKGKPAANKNFDYWGTYLGLWKQWARENPKLIEELRTKAAGKTLTDQFAKTDNNQARALAEILNETAPKQQQQDSKEQLRLLDPKNSFDELSNKTFQEVFESGDETVAARLKNPYMMFNREVREQVSVANAEGRGHLGQVANSIVYLQEAGHILKKNNGVFEVEETIRGTKYKLKYTLKSQAELDNAMKAASAALNMAADITEFNGLIPAREMLANIYNRAFKLDITKLSGDEGEKLDHDEVMVSRGLIGMLSKVKNFMYGRNYEQRGRNFTENEVMAGLEYFGKLYDGDDSTLLGMARNTLVDFQTYNPTIRPDNAASFEKMYEDYNASPTRAYWSVRMPAFAVKKVAGSTVDMFFKKKLYDSAERTRLVEDKNEVFWSADALRIVLRGGYKSFGKIWATDKDLEEFGKSKKWSDDIMSKKKAENQKKLNEVLASRYYRTQLVNEMHRLGEQWALNDIYDMVSAKMIDKYQSMVPKHLQSQIPKRILEPVQELLKLKDHLSGLQGEEAITAADRSTSLDQMYVGIRNNLSTDAEKELLDVVLLSSYKRGTKGTKAAKWLETGPKKYGSDDNKTRYSYESDIDQIALDLRSMDNKLPREFFNEYDALVTGEKTVAEITRILSDKEIKDIENNTREKLIAKYLTDIEHGKAIGTIVEDLRDMRIENMINFYVPLKPNPKILQKLKKDPEAYARFEKEYLPEYTKLKGYLENAVGPDIIRQNMLARGMTSLFADKVSGYDLSSMPLSEVKMMNRAFEQIHRPTMMNQLFGGKEPTNPYLKKVFYYQFPNEFHREQLRIAFQVREDEAYFVNRFGQSFKGAILTPTSGIENVGSTIHMADEMSKRVHEEYDKKLKTKLAGIRMYEFGEELENIAIHFHEDDAMISRIMASDLPMSVKQRKIENYKNSRMSAVIKYREILKKNPVITVKFRGEDGTDVIKDMTPASIVRYLKTIMTDTNREAYENIIKANDDALKNIAVKDKNGVPLYHWYYGKNKRQSTVPIIDEEAFYAKMQTGLVTNREWPIEFGIDGLRRVAGSLQLGSHYIKKGSPMTAAEIEIHNKSLEIIEKQSVTGQYPYEIYFPHMQTGDVSLRKDIADTIRAIESDTTMSKESKEKYIKKHVRDYIRRGGLIEDELPIDMHLRNAQVIADEINTYKTQKERDSHQLRYLKGVARAGNQMQREFFTEEYERTMDAYTMYNKRLVDTYYRNASQLVARIQIKKATQAIRKIHGDDVAQAWNKFMHLYAQGAAGYGVIIPKTYSEDPRMKIKGTLYNAYSDTVILDRVNKLATMLGIGKDKRDVFGIKEVFQQKDLANWSALEAKYSMATLLARPKSMGANLMGGSLNTIVYSGFKNFMKAQSITELQKIHPEFTTLEQWRQFIMDKGVIEDMLINEFNQSRYSNNKAMKLAIHDVVEKLKGNPDLDDKTIIDIFKKRGISEYMFNKAGWFMRTAERKLRTDAFLASYIQQVENFSPAIANGSQHAMLKFDSPILIEMAKRGVKATQYLYSAPFRPMFSTSALGKIMTRFQMYAYNSVEFRRDIANKAGLYGFKQGTVEYDRFKRFIIADMLSMAAATAFTYSIFDSNLPAPWSWVQDFGDYLFGDEKERERAFFGTYPGVFAPLQVITPPSMRIVGPTITGMLDNDFSKLANYTIWTMFPFGALTMDIKRSIDNPNMVIEKMTGFPLRNAATEILTDRNWITGEVTPKEKKEEKKTPNATREEQQRGPLGQINVR